MKEEISVYFRIVFGDGAAGERVIFRGETQPTFVCERLAIPGPVPDRSGPVPPQNHARMVPSWLAGYSSIFTVIRKQAALVYASSAKRTASTRPGPFLGTVFFLDRGLMMLMAEASSCVFKCAA